MLTQRTASSAWPEEVAARNGVIVASGYGIRIGIWRGRLRIEDGSGADRRSRLIHRAASGLKRLVVLGHTGSISLETFRWLADIKAGYLQIDADGRVLAAVGPLGTDRPSLRRAQALAALTEQGLALSRWLVDAKLKAQMVNLRRSCEWIQADEAIATIDAYMRDAAEAPTVDALRLCEAAAAAAYWQALAPLEIRFARRDTDRVPKHWRTFGGRSSPLANGARMAANPVNAILNYLYALLEAEAALAARIAGLDPGLGVMHADQDRRNSLAADLMEPLRPEVDAYVLDLVSSRTFSARDFHETSAGVCRITAPLTHELAETLKHWPMRMGRVAEDLADSLERKTSRGAASLPTPITGRRRAEGRPAGRRQRAGRTVRPSQRCTWCGSVGPPDRRTCGAACEAKVAEQRLEHMRRSSSDRMKRLAASPGHPALTDAANKKRRQTRVEQRQAELVWEREHPETPDLQAFISDVLPRLQKASVRAIAARTGMSVGYCASIKHGKRVPHPRWWKVLAGVA